MSDTARNPATWLTHIEACRWHKEATAPFAVTPWFSGALAPVRKGNYDRLFTDGIYRQRWDGKYWYSPTADKPHWRQVGDYPAWRGLMVCTTGETT
jgi:hypothetical protein